MTHKNSLMKDAGDRISYKCLSSNSREPRAPRRQAWVHYLMELCGEAAPEHVVEGGRGGGEGIPGAGTWPCRSCGRGDGVGRESEHFVGNQNPQAPSPSCCPSTWAKFSKICRPLWFCVCCLHLLLLFSFSITSHCCVNMRTLLEYNIKHSPGKSIPLKRTGGNIHQVFCLLTFLLFIIILPGAGGCWSLPWDRVMVQPPQRLGKHPAPPLVPCLHQPLWGDVLCVMCSWSWDEPPSLDPPIQEEPCSFLSPPLSSFASELTVPYFKKEQNLKHPWKAEESRKVNNSGVCWGHFCNRREKIMQQDVQQQRKSFLYLSSPLSPVCECLTSCAASEYKLCSAHSG